MLKAIVFDFDGVIVDSEKMHFDAFNRVGETFGIVLTWDEYLEQYIGYDDRDAFREMLGWPIGGGANEDAAHLKALCKAKADVFEQIVNEGCAVVPGVVELIEQAGAEIPIAIASGATRADIDLMLDKLGLARHFKWIVSADDVSRSKPDPESYTRAAGMIAGDMPELNLTATDCLAIEDTAAGIASARDAGMQVMGLTSTAPDESALMRAHRVVDTLEGLSVEQLHEWFDGEE